MPETRTVFRWLANEDEKFNEFRRQYARARDEQTDVIAEECLEIADDGRNDKFTDEKGNVVVDNDVIQRSKLRVETRRWFIGKLRPSKYGEKPTEIHANTTVNNFVVMSPERQKQLQERKAAALTRVLRN